LSPAPALVVLGLFSGLEEEAKRAGEVLLAEELGHTKEDGGMAVVPTGMHHAGRQGGIGDVTRLLDGQGVHIGAQGDDRVTGAAFPDDACAPDGGTNAAAHGTQLLRDKRGGAGLLEAELGVAVDIPPPGGELVLDSACSV
jgi:hypothetical protein